MDQGWAQVNTDTRHNPELHEDGGAYRQLKQRVFGTLTAVLLLLAVVVGIALVAD